MLSYWVVTAKAEVAMPMKKTPARAMPPWQDVSNVCFGFKGHCSRSVDVLGVEVPRSCISGYG
jgi:hypothetical protein